MPKHVIFLGAGASVTSGYPLGDDLRKEWLVSIEALHRRACQQLGAGFLDNSQTDPRMLQSWLDPIRQTLELFRQGGFGTIDEFCYLIRDSRPEDVARLKSILRFVFGLVEPEKNFPKSDYYRFIQQLFKPSALSELRDDVVVMSFNYDPYLEWLVRRAFGIRRRAIASARNSVDLAIDGAVTSGFSGGHAGVAAVRDGTGFCILKLHGFVAWPNGCSSHLHHSLKPHCSFDEFFEPDPHKRIGALVGECGNTETPIVFPWEIMNSQGQFVTRDQFRLRDDIHAFRDCAFRCGGRSQSDPDLYEIYKATWTRAKAEVQGAAQISFVGLSMHEYLDSGFRFLFAGRPKLKRVVITDRQSLSGPTWEPSSPTARAYNLLNELELLSSGNGIKVRADFSEFIQKEMRPL